MSSTPSIADRSARNSVAIFAAIGIVAWISSDMTHEVLGHMTAAWLSDVRITSLSTVAIQTSRASRFVAAAGTSANVIIGTLALMVFSHARGRTDWGYFLWLFAGFNLLNSGYLVVSAAGLGGDWAAVIEGLAPSWAWRCALGLVGAAIYTISVGQLARSMIGPAERNEIVLPELSRLILVAYLAAGIVQTLSAAFNPVSPTLILISGLGASFGLSWGLLLVPGLVGKQVQAHSATSNAGLPASRRWIGLAIVLGLLFVGVLGPGIRFHE